MRITAPTKPPSSEDFGPKVRAHQRYRNRAGKIVPGVTTVLGVLAKPALVGWANRLGLEGIDSRKYTDEAAAIGTLAHHMVECELAGQQPQLQDYSPAQVERAGRALRSWHEWRDSHTLQPQLVETQLVHDRFGFGGTVDCYGRLDYMPTLLDFKTSQSIYAEHIIQVSAYAHLLIEHGYTVRGVRILRIGRRANDGLEEHVLSGEQIRIGWGIFRHALEIYQLQKDLKRERQA